MPTGQFMAEAYHPFTTAELTKLRNRVAMHAWLPKYRAANHPTPITPENYEVEVIDRILDLVNAYPELSLACKDPKETWKHMVITEINYHRFDDYKLDPNYHADSAAFWKAKRSQPWNEVVEQAATLGIDICVGLDGGPLNSRVERMEGHNLMKERYIQSTAIKEWFTKQREWDEKYAEVFETQAEVSYKEAFARKDAALRKEGIDLTSDEEPQ